MAGWLLCVVSAEDRCILSVVATEDASICCPGLVSACWQSFECQLKFTNPQHWRCLDFYDDLKLYYKMTQRSCHRDTQRHILHMHISYF